MNCFFRGSFPALIVVGTAITLSAQPKQNSAFSRYGIGDPLPAYFANQAGWAGQTAAFHDYYHLNLSNPASYANLRTTTFETGAYAKHSRYTSSKDALNIWSGNLAYLSLGFTLNSPINEVLDKVKSPWRFGMGLALTPHTLIGYQLTTSDSTAEFGKVTNTYQGSGGTYRLSWSNAMRYKNTALGLTIGWLFGKSRYETRTDFDADATLSFLNNFRNDLRISGFLYNVGLQHDVVIKRTVADKKVPLKWITLGLTANNPTNHNLLNEKLYVRSRGTGAGGQFFGPDTLINLTGKNALLQNLRMPARLSAGIQYVHSGKIRVGAQADFEQWAQYVNEARPETLRNTYGLSAGFEYIPDFISYNNYGKRMRYRGGIFYKQDPRAINNTYLNQYGLTFGLGLPITLPRQQTSFINAAFEIGSLGDGAAIEELYGKITIGFTLNDNTWFFQRRFE